MNSEISFNILRCIILIFLQVLLFNNILISGFINPFPYIIFILLFPISPVRWLYLICAFLYGLSLDIFGNSGGAHAAACLCIAYIRPFILGTSFGISYEHQNLRLSNTPLKELIIYVCLMCTTHHLILFSLEVFDLTQLYFIIQQTLFSSLFSIFVILLSLFLFYRK